MEPSSFIHISTRLYGRLLFLYPGRFRHEYGREMTLVFRDRSRALAQTGGRSALVRFWFGSMTDLVSTAVIERLEERISMSKAMWVRIIALIAITGGVLGLALVTRGTNDYGNYGWHGSTAWIPPVLLALGFVGWLLIAPDRIGSRNLWGTIIIVLGFLLMAVGLVVESLWFLIFFGPLIIVPTGALVAGSAARRSTVPPGWWRLFPFVIVAVALLGLGIEVWEGIIQDTTPDRGLLLAEALFSAAWVGLGIGLWLIPTGPTARPGAA